MVKHTKHGKDALKRKDASVIMHGDSPCVPQEHYQMEVGSSVFPKYSDTPEGAFLAGNGRVRPQPHKMINECDH